MSLLGRLGPEMERRKAERPSRSRMQGKSHEWRLAAHEMRQCVQPIFVRVRAAHSAVVRSSPGRHHLAEAGAHSILRCRPGQASATREP
jgi:hypothetical protein